MPAESRPRTAPAGGGLSGIFPAVVTPLDAAGRFREDSFRALLARLYDAGADGVYVCGQTGEGLEQPPAQRAEVMAAAVAASPKGRTVIAHIGAADLEASLRLAESAARTGAHMLSSLPPPGEPDYPALQRYYRTLAAATGLPFLIYYVPRLAASIQDLGQLRELCEIPNVVGLKYTDFDLFRLSRLCASGAVVMNGRDEILAAGLFMGASGGIGSTYNLFPEVYVRMMQCARQGCWAEARRLQECLNGWIEVLLRFPVFPAIKTVLRWSGIDCGECLPPRRPLTDTERGALERELRAAGCPERLLAGA